MGGSATQETQGSLDRRLTSHGAGVSGPCGDPEVHTGRQLSPRRGYFGGVSHSSPGRPLTWSPAAPSLPGRPGAPGAPSAPTSPCSGHEESTCVSHGTRGPRCPGAGHQLTPGSTWSVDQVEGDPTCSASWGAPWGRGGGRGQRTPLRSWHGRKAVLWENPGGPRGDRGTVGEGRRAWHGLTPVY